jgi:hypothetical protein
MEIVNTSRVLPCNLLNVIWVILGLVALGILIYLLCVIMTEDFKFNVLMLIIIFTALLGMSVSFAIDGTEKTYSTCLIDMTLKELETEYEPYDIDGLILKCTKIKKGEMK